MERSRESRRPGPGSGGVTNRRLRGGASSTKDISDEDERMDDSPENRAWERSKKDRMRAFQCLSRNKRRRQDINLQSRNSICEDVDEYREETETLGWDDDDEDEPPPRPPVPRRLGKFRGGGKEDEMIMDIPMVPRKARSALSASSRFSVLKRPLPTDNLVLQYASVTSDGISSPNYFGKSVRKPKSNGMKFRPLKSPKVLEPATISDQEVEVAEALFVLARSAPSNAVLSHGKFDCKSEAKMETGLSASSSPPPLPLTTLCPSVHASSALVDGHSRNAPLPMAEAPKRKRPRVIMKQEEGRAEGSSSARSNTTLPSATPEMVEGPPSEAQQRSEAHIDISNVPNDKHSCREVEEIKGSAEENHVSGEVEPVKSEPQELGELNGEIVLSSKRGDVPAEWDTTLIIQRDIRSGEIHDDNGCASPSKLDLMACAVMEPSADTNAKQLLINDHSALSGDGHAEPAHAEDENSQQEAMNEEMDNSSKANGGPVDLNLEEKHETEDLLHDPLFINHASKLPKEEEKEMDSESIKRALKTTETDTDTMTSGLFPPSMPDVSGSSLAFASWMSSLPARGYYSPGAPSWPSTGPLLGSDLDVKSVHPSMQLPPSAIVPRIAKLKRCAAHVYLAHFINREQHCFRHSIWSAALCRGAPYGLNIPPLDTAYADLARKGIAPQSSMSGMALGGTSLCSSSATSTACQSAIGGVAHESGSVAAAGGNINVAAHAQYIQAMMQQNGYTFPFTFNAPHGQASQFFNASPFYPAHLMSALSHIQSLSQQASAVLPAHKQQHGMTGVLTNASQLPSQVQTPPAATQQCSPSTSQKPQQSHIGSSAQNFYMHPEKDNAENLSTAESRLSALQRSMCGQVLSNLPNLNAIPSSLMLSSTVSAMPLQPQDLSLANIGGKLANKTYQNTSLISSVQHQQSVPQTNAVGAGLQIDGRDSLSECLPSMGLSGISRASISPGSYGLLPVAPMMTPQSHGLALEASESSRDHTQQQQVFGSHSQQFQMSMAKSSGPAASDASLVCSKGRNSIEEKKAAVKQGIYYSEGTMSSMHSSPITGSQPNTQPASNAGWMLNPASATVPHTSRPTSSAGQVASLQNQNSKQAMGRGKTLAGNSFPQNAAANVQMVHGLVPGFADRSLPVNLGKLSGNIYAFPGVLTPAKQGPKQVQGATAGKGAQRMSFGQSQQVPASVVTKALGQPLSRATNYQQGVSGAGTPQILPSVPSSGTLSMPIANPSSASKTGVVVPTSCKSPSNVKGNMSSVKSAQGSACTATRKLLSVSGPLITSVGGAGQSLPYKAPAQQKNQTQVHSSFTQPQQIANVSIQQQRIALKNSIGPQQQLQPPQQGSIQYKPSLPVPSSYRSDAVEHQLQYVQPPSQTSSHLYYSTPQSSAMYMQAQHRISYEQQHLVSHQASPSTVEAVVANSLATNSTNFSLGSVIAESISAKVGDQLQGASPPTKASSSFGITQVENIVSVGPSAALVSGQQVRSPHSASSPYYFQLSHVLAAKATEPKT